MPHSSRRSCIAECAYWIVGCGPGTITLDFAELVAPGRVFGIDLEPTQLNYAQRRSREQQLNASFAVASVAKRPSANRHHQVIVVRLGLEIDF